MLSLTDANLSANLEGYLTDANLRDKLIWKMQERVNLIQPVWIHVNYERC